MAKSSRVRGLGLRREPAPQQSPQLTLGAHKTKLSRDQILKELKSLYTQGLRTPPAQIGSVPDSVVDLPSEVHPILKRDDAQFVDPEIDSGANFGSGLNDRDSEADLGDQHGVDEPSEREFAEGSAVSAD